MKLDKYQKQAVVRAIMADVPKPNRAKRRADIQAEVVKLMSPAVRKVYNATPEALRTQHLGDVIYDGSWSSRDIITGDVHPDAVAVICQPYVDEDHARHKVEGNLKAVVDGCSTLKRLKDRLPEFIEYFPTEEAPTANLPAITNVVADLSKLGWPKGAKP
jgi:hypothetical protein